MKEPVLAIEQFVLQSIIEHCIDERPYEACGILIGQPGRVCRAFATDNAVRSPIYYEVEPRHQALVLKEMEARGETLVGIYHSHPTASERPSANDVKMAMYYPEAVRLIISLAGPTAVGAYLISGETVQTVRLEVGDGTGGEFHDLRHL